MEQYFGEATPKLSFGLMRLPNNSFIPTWNTPGRDILTTICCVHCRREITKNMRNIISGIS